MDDCPDSRGFTPISPNPFIVGNPVRDSKMFFGREAEFELVRKRFKLSSAKGGLLVFCGERRSGKTSILFQIEDGRLGEEFIPVLIDMQSMAIESEIAFLGKIAEEIRARLGPNTADSPRFSVPDGSTPSAAMREFVGDVLGRNPAKKLILMFDEYELFENKIDAGILGSDVLYILSNLMEQQRVFIIFTGSIELELRRRDYWRIFLGKSVYRRISYLDFEDTRRLITEPVGDRVQYEDGLIDRIYRLTAGQPFYTQAICLNLVDLLNERRTSRASLQMLSSVVDEIVNNPFPQMLFLWDGLERDQKLVLAVLAETLPDESGFADCQDLVHTLAAGSYPLDLDVNTISSSLESLFKQEMLLKDESRQPRYAFRMDIWRRWIQRMHSVWQVMRELGLEIRPARRRRRRLLGLTAAAAVLAVTLIAVTWIAKRDGGGGRGDPSGDRTGPRQTRRGAR